MEPCLGESFTTAMGWDQGQTTVSSGVMEDRN